MPKPKSFEFCLIHVGHLGGNSLSNYLNANPDIAIIQPHIADELFNSGKENEIFDENYYPEFYREKKIGFHLHLARRLFPPENGQQHIGKKLANVTGSLVEDGLAIQVVRDPLPHMVSIYNYQVTQRQIEITKNSGKEDNYGVGNIDHFIERSAQMFLKSFDIRQRTTGNIANWEVVDTGELAGDRITGTIANLYRRLGVYEHYKCELFAERWSGLEERYMTDITIDLDLGLRTLPFRIAFQNDPSYQLGDYFVAAKGPSINGQMDFKFRDRPVQLVVLNHLWCSLPRKFRSDLVWSGRLQDMFNQKVLPYWIHAVNALHADVEPQLITGLQMKHEARVRELISEDVANMREAHPKLEDLWKF